MVEQLEQYEGLVKNIVSRYNFYGDYDDLYQSGMIGLMKAVKKYDQTKTTNFMDYAYLYIKGEVLKTLNGTNQIKISPEMYKLKQEVKKTADELLQAFGREATSQEISYVLGQDVTTIEKIRTVQTSTYSLDEEKEEEANQSLYNKVAKIEMGYDAGILDLKTALAGLEQSEQVLINSRYYEDMTQQETARRLGISQVQVSRQEKKILSKLKNDLTI